MNKKIEDTDVEVKPGTIPEPREEREDREPKRPSVRESLMAAVKEQEDKEKAADGKDEPTDTAEEIEAKKQATAERKAKKEAKEKAEAEAAEVKDEVDELKEVTTKEEDEAETPKVEEPKEKANIALPKEVKDDWVKLSPATRNYLNKQVKELSDVKAEYGRTLARVKDMDAVVAPHLDKIKNFGVTPAHTVGKLFEWMDGLTGPNRLQVYQQLGRAFQIPTAGNNQDDPQIDNQDQGQSQVLQEITPVLQNFGNQLGAIQTQIEAQKQAEADNAIFSWAGLQADGSFKNKPYFGEVRGLMATFLKNGSIPLVNGRPDLDTAYTMACRAHPQVFEAIQQEESTAKAAEEAKAKEAAAKKAKLDAAKRAGVGIRSGAPIQAAPSRKHLNGKPNSGKPLSVRDSIYGAIKELQE